MEQMNTKKGQFEPAEVGKLFAKHFSNTTQRGAASRLFGSSDQSVIQYSAPYTVSFYYITLLG
jgi:hypothetical protein